MKKSLFAFWKSSASAFVAVAVAFSGVFASPAVNAFKIAAGAEDIPSVQQYSDNETAEKVLESDKFPTEPVVIGADEDITIDLAGHKYSRGLSAPENNGCVFTVKGKLTISDSSDAQTGRVVSGRNTGNGGCIYIADGGTLTLKSGSISNGEALKGAAVYVEDGGKFIIDGGVIKDCTAAYGGAVYVEEGGTFEMNGGKITNCTAEDDGNGGAVFVKGSFTMNGGEISGNTAVLAGGGVFIGVMGQFAMTGGTISDNTAAYGAGVSAGSDAVFSLGGGDTKVVIDGNTLTESGDKCNVYLGTDSLITIAGTAADGSKVGITTSAVPAKNSPVTITNGFGSSAAFLVSDNTDYVVKKESGYGAAVLALAPDNFTRLQMLADNTDNGGTLKLTTDYTHDVTDDIAGKGALQIAAGKTLILDLNGHKIDRALWNGSTGSAEENGAVIENAGTLIITDTSDSADGVIKGGNNSGNGGGIVNTGTLTISGGSVECNRAGGADSVRGGGIYSTGTVTVSGGYVRDNKVQGTKSSYGGGIYLDGTASLTMSGGEISGNVSAGYGGGVYADMSCDITMTGGKVTGNTVSRNYGGICVGKSFTVSGAAEVSGNKKSSDASNVYLPLGKAFKVTGTLTGKIYVTTENKPYSDIKIASGYGTHNVTVPPYEIFFSDEGYYIKKNGSGDVVLSLTEQYNKLTENPTIKIMRGETEITDNNPMAGDVLIASTNASGLTYEWHYSDAPEDEPLSTASTYTVKLDDIGNCIIVTVKQSEEEDGTAVTPVRKRSSAATGEVSAKDAPAAPDSVTAEYNSISITVTYPLDDDTHDYEYSIDGTSWQDAVTFTGLTPDTLYTLRARVKATSDTPASPSATAEITTDKAHVHSFGYSVKGNVLTATCTAAKCPIEGSKAVLTLGIDGGTYTGGAFKAELDLDEFNEKTGLNAEAVITYNGNKTAPVSAGKYTAKAVVTADYRTFNLTKDFTIDKAQTTVTKEPAGLTCEYDRQPHTLVKSGTAVGGTIYYRVGTDGVWTETPTATEPAEYKVFWYVLGDSDHTDLGSTSSPYGFVEAYIIGDVIISKGVTLTPASVDHDGEAKSFTVTVVVGSKTLTENADYTVKVLNDADEEVTECVNAGVYSVVVTGAGKYAGEVTKYFTIRGMLITDRDGKAFTDAPIYGDTLKASVIPDIGDYTYQWVRVKDGISTDIQGATSATYIISSAEDMGCSFKVKVISDGVMNVLGPTKPAEKAENINGVISEDDLVITAASSDTTGDGKVKINGYTSSKPVEYSINGGKTWLPARNGLITGLFNGTVVRIRYAGDNTHKAGETVVAIMPGTIILVGVSLSGTESYGETLSAYALPAPAEYFEYSWYRSSGDDMILIEDAVEPEYTLGKDDIGCRIRVTVSDGISREYSAYTKGYISKRTLPAPEVSGSLVGSIDKGIISGLDITKKYEYSTDGGKTWIKVQDGSASITGLTEGTYIVREQLTDPSCETALTTEITLEVTAAEQFAPTGLTPVYVTAAGMSDGGIRGVDAAMEYSADGKTWSPVVPVSAEGKPDTLTGLSQGTYYVRRAKVYSGTVLIKNESPSVTVAIKVKEAQAAPTGIVVTGVSAPDKSDGILRNVSDEMEYSTDGGKSWKAVPAGKTEITGFSSGDNILVRFSETDTKLAGVPFDAGVVGNADRVITVNYLIGYAGTQLSDKVSLGRHYKTDSFGIGANTEFFTKASKTLGLGTGESDPHIVSYTIIAKALYSDGSPVESEYGIVDDMIDCISAEEFVEYNGIAYYVEGEYNEIYVRANVGGYATDSGDFGVMISAPSAVPYTGLPHIIADDPAADKADAAKKVSDDLYIELVDRKTSRSDYDGYELVCGTDYTVSYKNNVNASVEIGEISGSTYYRQLDATASRSKSPQIIITGKGNYKGMKAVIFFDILPLHLAQASGAAGSFANAVPEVCTVKNGSLVLDLAPVRYARVYDKNIGRYVTDTSVLTKYVLGKDISAELQVWNANKESWTSLGGITDNASRKAAAAKATTAGAYRVRLTGIGNFCGTVTDEFTVAGAGSLLFSSLKLKTASPAYAGSGVSADALVTGISTKINKTAVAASDYDVTLQPVSAAAAVSADGKTALAAGTYTAVVVPKDAAAFARKYSGTVFDAPITATVKVKSGKLTAKMFTADWNSRGEAYTGNSRSVTVTLNGITADDVAIAYPTVVNGKAGYAPYNGTPDSIVERSGNRLIIKSGFIKDGKVTSTNAAVGAYSIAFYGKRGYADSVYIYTFKRVGANLTSSMVNVSSASVNISGTFPEIKINSPDGRTIRVYKDSSDYSVTCKPASSVGSVTATIKVVSDNTVFKKGASASITFKVAAAQISKIFPYSEYSYDKAGYVFLKMDDTALAGKKAPQFTLYQASADGKKLTALGKNDYSAKLTANSDGKTYDLVISNGTSGNFDFGKGITIPSAYVTYSKKASKWTGITFAATAALIRDRGNGRAYTSSDISAYRVGSVSVTSGSGSKYSASYAGGCYVLPVISQLTVDGRTLSFIDGYYNITYRNNNKVGTATLIITLTQKAVKEFDIGGSTSVSFGITSQSSSGLVL